MTPLQEAIAVVDRLRSAGGCPWYAEQTHASLAAYLLEEAYETVDAIDSGDRAHMREELGDVLFQVLLHSRIAQENDTEPWTVEDVAADLTAKLVRRNPHVFADVTVDGVAQVEANWNAIKAAEKGRTGPYDGLVWSAPALSLASKAVSRAARAQLPIEPQPPTSDEQRVGQQLLAVVQQAATLGVDPELALRRVVRQLATTTDPISFDQDS